MCVLWYCVPPFCSFPREGPSRADIITYASKEPARPKRDPTKAIWTCITAAQQRHPHRDVFIHDSFDWPADQRSDWTLCGWIAESQKYHAQHMMCWPHSRWNMKELLLFSLSKKKKKTSSRNLSVCPFHFASNFPLPCIHHELHWKIQPQFQWPANSAAAAAAPFLSFLKNIKEFFDLFRVCVCGSPSRVSKKKRAERITVVCNITGEHSSYSSAYY